jgi:AAA domain
MSPISRDRTPGPRRKPLRRVSSTPMLGAQYVQIHWLWRQYVALGKITLLAGLAGQGKSQLTCLLAAMTTRGYLDAPAGDVLIVSGEDDKQDTIFPRLGASGADPHRVGVVDVREHNEDGSVTPTTLSMPDDARGLREELKRLMSPRLLILDPVNAFLAAGVDSNKDPEIRRALAPLKSLAEDFAIAILLVTHLNKAREVEPLMRITGSGAYTALARGVLLMAADPEDEEGDRGKDKIMALAKSNIAMSGEHSLRFRISSTQTTDDYGTTVEVGAIEWIGRSPLSAHDLLVPAADRPALDEARIFLRAELADGWHKASDVKKAASAYGLSDATLRRAREQECQRPRQFERAWWWALRNVPWNGNGQMPRAREDREHEHLEHLKASDVPDAAGQAVRAREDTWHLELRDRITGERWEDE